jgi:tRNA-Thr(GGU) m(6)t(6)A37 methyltransferase TsaA
MSKRHIQFEPIGYVRTVVAPVPRHWTVSDAEGTIEIDEAYHEGLKDLRPGQRIVVLFHFHESPKFTPEFLVQKPPVRDERLGVFSICSPIRPNPIGMSVVEVLSVEGTKIRIRGLDMRDGTPVLDIKPAMEKGAGSRGQER